MKSRNTRFSLALVGIGMLAGTPFMGINASHAEIAPAIPAGPCVQPSTIAESVKDYTSTLDLSKLDENAQNFYKMTVEIQKDLADGTLTFEQVDTYNRAWNEHSVVVPDAGTQRSDLGAFLFQLIDPTRPNALKEDPFAESFFEDGANKLTQQITDGLVVKVSTNICEVPSETPTPTPSETPSTPAETPTPSETPSTPVETPTPSETPSTPAETPIPSETPSATPSATETPYKNPKADITGDPTPTPTRNTPTTTRTNVDEPKNDVTTPTKVKSGGQASENAPLFAVAGIAGLGLVGGGIYLSRKNKKNSE